MKTKIFTLACILICMLATFTSMAQQPQYAKSENAALQIAANSGIINYTYKIFEAPNKMYGYDIFRNDKIVFHQGASGIQSNNLIAAIAKKEHAEKAALLTIEKIKKGAPAALTQKEIKKIISQ